MKISSEIFPFYEECRAKFGVSLDDLVVFTYGDTIHARCSIPADLLAHEQVHSIQQEKMGKDLWWKMYLENPDFRLSQEVQAYRKQYQFVKSNNREQNFKFLSRLAKDLSSPTYGGIVTYSEALKFIK